MPVIGELEVSPLCLGGNVFGWTADAQASERVLDRFVERFPRTAFVDTADMYSQWAQGHTGGESERVIGRWLRRHDRDDVVIATKVGKLDGLTTLDETTIREALTGSLERLGVDHVDLYYAHRDDADTPLEETVGAFSNLVDEGLVREVGASNISRDRLAAALDVAAGTGGRHYVAVQNRLSLLDRAQHGPAMRTLCLERGLAAVPYHVLESGFLTGKYRPDGDEVDSPRAAGAYEKLGSDRGRAVLDAADEVAARHGVPVATVSLAWAAAQQAVAAPIASATTVEQLEDLLAVSDVVLTDDDLVLLDQAASVD